MVVIPTYPRQDLKSVDHCCAAERKHSSAWAVARCATAKRPAVVGGGKRPIDRFNDIVAVLRVACHHTAAVRCRGIVHSYTGARPLARPEEIAEQVGRAHRRPLCSASRVEPREHGAALRVAHIWHPGGAAAVLTAVPAAGRGNRLHLPLQPSAFRLRLHAGARERSQAHRKHRAHHRRRDAIHTAECSREGAEIQQERRLVAAPASCSPAVPPLLIDEDFDRPRHREVRH